MSNKNSVRNAIVAIKTGNARALRDHLKEALLYKTKQAIDNKEKQLAKSLLNQISESTSLNESEPKTAEEIKKAIEVLKQEVKAARGNARRAWDDWVEADIQNKLADESQEKIDDLTKKLESLR